MSRLIDIAVVVSVWAAIVVILAPFGVPGSVEFAVALAAAVFVMLVSRKRRVR